MKYLNRQALLARGWKYCDVDNLLPPPIHSASVPVWAKKDVLKVERSREWQVSRAISSKLEKKRDITPYINYINGLEITLPDLSLDELAEETLAVQNAIYELNRQQTGVGYTKARPSSKEVMDRWELNYLRHIYTDLDRLKDKWAGRPGSTAKITLYKIRFLEIAREKYPHLKDECDKQLKQLKKIKLF